MLRPGKQSLILLLLSICRAYVPHAHMYGVHDLWWEGAKMPDKAGRFVNPTGMPQHTPICHFFDCFAPRMRDFYLPLGLCPGCIWKTAHKLPLLHKLGACSLIGELSGRNINMLGAQALRTKQVTSANGTIINLYHAYSNTIEGRSEGAWKTSTREKEKPGDSAWQHTTAGW
jgi:hypothetical protein